jgi:hypothetical protein
LKQTVTRQPGRNSNIINIYIVEDDRMEVTMQDKTTFNPSMARKLLHEVAGHGVPWVRRMPGIRVGNAITTENVIIDEIYHTFNSGITPLRLLREVSDDRWYNPDI